MLGRGVPGRTRCWASPGNFRLRTGRRAFELDAIAFRVVEVDGRPPSFRAVAGDLRPAACPVCLEMTGDGGGIKRLDPQAEMIEIGAPSARGTAGRARLVGRHDIDQRAPGAQLGELALPQLERAAQRLDVEALQR